MVSDASLGRRLSQRALTESAILLVIAAWWLTSAQLPEAVFPSPPRVAGELLRMAGDGEFWGNAAITALRVVASVLLATVLGTVIGIAPRYLPWARGIVDDVLIPFFNAFPSIAWAILGTVWFGVSPSSVFLVQTLIILPFCLVNVAEGAKEIGQEEVEMGLSFGRRRWAIFWRIELPMLRPFIFAGLRIAYGVCWKIALVAELFGASSGLGYMMQRAQDFGRVESIIAICLAIVFFVVVVEALLLRPLSRTLETGRHGAGEPEDARATRARPAPGEAA